MSLVENKEHMKLYTCHFPKALITIVDRLVEKKWFPNRSEAIRVGLYNLVIEWMNVLHEH